MSRIRAAYWDPDGERYGIPTFWWKGAPPGYATRRQLRAAGLRPGGQPVAAQVLCVVLVVLAWRTCTGWTWPGRSAPPPPPNAWLSARR